MNGHKRTVGWSPTEAPVGQQTVRSRAGFSLVELLVVIGIIGVLLALLLPAVQKVRESAARSQCGNNLRQLAMAVHHFHDVEKCFPQGRFGGAYGSGPKSTAWSWLARLLPYVEQQNTYLEGNIPSRTLAASGVADRSFAMFLCPSDPSAVASPRLDAGNLKGFAVGLTSYKGVSGANWGDDLTGVGPIFDTDWRNQGTNWSFDGLADGDGIFYRADWKRKLSLQQIQDGTSNTFMIGEDSPGVHIWCSWPYANNAYGTCAIPPNVKNKDGKDYEPWNWQNTLEPVRVVFDPNSPCHWQRSQPDLWPLFSLRIANPLYWLAALGLIGVGIRKGWLTTYEWSLGLGLLLVPYLLRGHEMCMLGMGRFTAVVFPIYLVLGQLLARMPAPMAAALVGLMAFFLGAYAVLFAAWYRIF